MPPFPVCHGGEWDRRYGAVQVNLNHTPVQNNRYQHRHDFHAKADKACFEHKQEQFGDFHCVKPGLHGRERGGNINAGAAADHARRAGNNVLCHVEYRHSDVKGMRDDKHRNERFEKPLKEHERVNVVQIVLFRYHADKLHA